MRLRGQKCGRTVPKLLSRNLPCFNERPRADAIPRWTWFSLGRVHEIRMHHIECRSKDRKENEAKHLLTHASCICIMHSCMHSHAHTHACACDDV
jgi:hypothetical protein